MTDDRGAAELPPVLFPLSAEEVPIVRQYVAAVLATVKGLPAERAGAAAELAQRNAELLVEYGDGPHMTVRIGLDPPARAARITVATANRSGEEITTTDEITW